MQNNDEENKSLRYGEGQPLNNVQSILVYGYGNTTRRDDRLGIDCIALLQEWISANKIRFITCKTSPQLNIEDAEEISNYDLVILVDASIDDIGGVQFSGVEIEENAAFTTHTVSPSHLLKLSRELYAGNPLVYLLQIQGYEWDFSEELTREGEKNLQKAVNLLKQKLAEFQR